MPFPALLRSSYSSPALHLSVPLRSRFLCSPRIGKPLLAEHNRSSESDNAFFFKPTVIEKLLPKTSTSLSLEPVNTVPHRF